MQTSLASFIDLYKFPGGRREHALSQLQGLAQSASWKTLADHCAAAVKAEQKLRDKRRAFATAKKQPADPRLGQIDAKIDRTVGAIYRGAQEAVTTLAGTPEAESAQALIDTLFPEGVAAITHQTFAEQNKEVASIVKQLQGGMKSHVTALGLGLYVSQLAALNAEQSGMLEKLPGESVTSEQIRADDQSGQERLLQAVAMILGRHHSNNAADQQSRAKLLIPIVLQNEAIRAYLRDRRAVPDVDPASGEEIVKPQQSGGASG